MSDRNEKNILEKGMDKAKDIASSVKETVKEGYDELVGNSTTDRRQDDYNIKPQCPYMTEKEEGGIVMDKGYWDDKGMYYKGPSEDQVLYPG